MHGRAAASREQSVRPVSLSGREGGREEREKEGKEDHMVGWVPPLAVCGYRPVRLFSKI